MRLTALRLVGFKSFVEPTELRIEPGLTGVVGPNGCGKSNLIEALRWVMGENSARRLRGGEMDDVIFAGTQTRPPRSIAEVMLSIDNSERRAPVAHNDDDEIEVVRRIERARGSSYRINGRESRARDVQILFADAATGAQSSGIVSQGRIGALIAAKPADRRALIEEAAGIAGLHGRRNEAEGRLKAAENNLVRLDDVITTLESQLQVVRKQVRQAKRYRSVSAAIRRVEARLLFLRHRAARAAESDAEAALREAERVVAERTQAATAAERARIAAGESLPGLRQAEAERGAAVQRLTLARGELEAEAQRVAQEIHSVRQRLAEIERDRGREQAHIDDAEATSALLAEEDASLAAEQAGEGDALAAAGAARGAAAEAVAAVEQEAAAVQAVLAEAEAEARTVAREAEVLERRAGTHRGETARIGRERERLAGATSAEGEVAAARAALEGADGAVVSAQARAEAAEAAGTARRAALDAADKAARDVDTERGRLAAERRALAEVVQSGRAAGPDRLADRLVVAGGYEAAVGAAFGDAIDAPVDAAGDPFWTTLPALDLVPPVPEGGRRLAEVVSGPPAIDRRTAATVVVDDAETARRLHASLAAGQTLVTRDGATWRWDGLVASPEAGSKRATAAIEQRARLRVLDEALAGAMEKVAAAVAERDRLRADADGAAAEDREARAALRTAMAEAQAARKALADAERRRAAVAGQMQALAAAEAQAAREGEAIEELSRAVAARRAAIPDMEASRGDLARARETLAARRREEASARDEEARLRQAAAGRKARRHAIAREREGWRARAEASRSQVAALAERAREADERRMALEARPAEIARQRQGLMDEIEGAEIARSEARDRLAEAELGAAETERLAKAAEAELGRAREGRVRSEADLEQAGARARAVVERVSERLGCAPDELAAIAAGEEGGEPEPGDESTLAEKLSRLQREREGIGPVNLRAEQEAAELEEQIAGLMSEREDLTQAIGRLRHAISQLNREGRERLLVSFEAVNSHFGDLFQRLFGGGRAYLELVESEDPLAAGLEIFASPPGKRLQSLSLFSGGEQALTAVALLFAVFLVNPAPICVLDEADAPLDDANIERFCNLLDHIVGETGTRFVVITHHRLTMARMNRLYGVTMAERGVSRLVSVDLERAEQFRDVAA